MAEASPDIRMYSRNVKCDLCDNGNKVVWYCGECRQNMCDVCEGIHSKSTASRFHHATPVQTPRPASSRESIASDFVGETEAVEMCLLHKSEICTDYCNLCDLFVCEKCKLDSHRTHLTVKTDVAAESKICDLNKKIHALENYETDRLNKIIQAMEGDRILYLKTISDQKMEVQTRTEKFLEMINEFSDIVLNDIDTKEQVDLQFMTRKENHIRNLLESYHNTARICRELIKQEQGVSLIKQCKEADHLLGKLEMAPSDSSSRVHTTPPSFVPGDLNKVDLQRMFGILKFEAQEHGMRRRMTFAFPKNVKARVIGIIKQKARHGVYSVASTGNGNAILGTEEPSIQVVNTFGKIIASMKIDGTPYSLACTQYGEDVYVSTRGMVIKKLSEGSFSTFVQTSPFHVQGLAVTGDGDLVACLYSKAENFGKVVKYSKEGEIIQRFVHNENKEYLFLNPEKVAVAANGDIFVVDTEKKCVTSINTAGTVAYIYNGFRTEKFEPNCLACGPYKSLLIGDKTEERVHLLDRNGHFLMNILEKEQGLSEVLSISTDLNTNKLWATCYDRVIVAALET